MAKLCYKDPTGVKREFPLKGTVTVGRHPGQDIQVLDRVVSKEHCRIEFVHGRYSIRDVGSRNGTYINGIRISSRRPLVNGDEVSIGSTTLKFVEEKEDALMNRVTIHESGVESNIRSRLTSQQERGFLPADQIDDLDALRQDYEKLRIAVELQQVIGLEFDLERMLEKILEQAFVIVPADRGVILLRGLDEDGVETLLPKVVKTRNANESADSIKISQTILREVQEEKTAVLSNDAMMDSRFSGAHSIILERIRSTMSVPLLYKDKLLGVMHLDSQIASGAFGERDLQLLTNFARQAAFNIEHSRVVQQMEQEIVARENIKRLLSPQLVEEVVQGRVEIQKGGDSRDTTILFSDIRGFTPLSEAHTAQELVDLLNAYFEVMVDVIFEYEGTLDKFVGDEIMALWGAPIAIEDAAYKCVACALAMQAALDQFNAARRMRFDMLMESGKLPRHAHFWPIHMGVGVNTGTVVAGYVGSSKSLSYTVMGDPVNTASRFCSVAGPSEILIGRPTYEAIRDRIDAQALPPAMLKGKSEPVEVFRVLGFKDPNHPLATPRQIDQQAAGAPISTARVAHPRHDAQLNAPTHMGLSTAPDGAGAGAPTHAAKIVRRPNRISEPAGANTSTLPSGGGKPSRGARASDLPSPPPNSSHSDT